MPSPLALLASGSTTSNSVLLSGSALAHLSVLHRMCGAEVEPTAQHALSCKKLRSRLSRHSRGNDVILRGLASADLPSTLEPPGLCLSDGKRPVGLTLFPWSRGKSLAWDFTCVNRLAASYSRNATAPGSVIAACAEEKKFKKMQRTGPRLHHPARRR